MTIVQNTPERLVVQAGSPINKCTLTLDRTTGHARLDRTLLLWPRKPVEFALADIDHVDVITSHDPASRRGYAPAGAAHQERGGDRGAGGRGGGGQHGDAAPGISGAGVVAGRSRPLRGHCRA